MHIEGLVYGKPFVELNNCTYIISSSGYVSKIDYSGKGWLSGKKNSFTASLYPQGKEKEVIYTAEGQWTDQITFKKATHGLKKVASDSNIVDTYNAKTTPTTPLKTAPLDQQVPYESNRAWQKVAEGIQKGDMDTVHIEKSKIENAQRELRRKEQAEGREWQRSFFKKSMDDATFEKLGKPLGTTLEPEKTNGVWRFDESKKAERESPDGVKVDQPPPSKAPQVS